MRVINDKMWKIIWLDKNLYAQIMKAEVSGTNKVIIKKQEWIVVDCEKDWNWKKFTLTN